MKKILIVLFVTTSAAISIGGGYTPTVYLEGSGALETVEEIQTIEHQSERELELIYHNLDICWDTPMAEMPKEVQNSLYELGMWHLKYTEGLRLKPYKCAAGVTTIGWGHALRRGERFDSITVEQANEMLRKDFQRRMDDVIETYPHIKDRHRQWAVAMFAFNMKGGVRALKGTNLERHILDSDWDAAADQLLKWNKAYNPQTKKYRPLRGLTKKRRFEAYLLRGTEESIEKAFAKKEYYQDWVISKIAKAKET